MCHTIIGLRYRLNYQIHRMYNTHVNARVQYADQATSHLLFKYNLKHKSRSYLTISSQLEKVATQYLIWLDHLD